MGEFTIKVHEIATDGYPDMDNLVGRVAFIFDGCLVTGWPLYATDLDADNNKVTIPDGSWEADSSVGSTRPFCGVTHWVEFAVPICQMEKARG